MQEARIKKQSPQAVTQEQVWSCYTLVLPAHVAIPDGGDENYPHSLDGTRPTVQDLTVPVMPPRVAPVHGVGPVRRNLRGQCQVLQRRLRLRPDEHGRVVTALRRLGDRPPPRQKEEEKGQPDEQGRAHPHGHLKRIHPHNPCPFADSVSHIHLHGRTGNPSPHPAVSPRPVSDHTCGGNRRLGS